jgi:hypothetical protein
MNKLFLLGMCMFIIPIVYAANPEVQLIAPEGDLSSTNTTTGNACASDLSAEYVFDGSPSCETLLYLSITDSACDGRPTVCWNGYSTGKLYVPEGMEINDEGEITTSTFSLSTSVIQYRIGLDCIDSVFEQSFEFINGGNCVIDLNPGLISDNLTTTSNQVTFEANFTDDGILSNATLVILEDGEEFYSETKTLSGSSDTKTWSLITVPQGVSTWYIEVYDTLGNSGVSDNKTIITPEPETTTTQKTSIKINLNLADIPGGMNKPNKESIALVSILGLTTAAFLLFKK